jgi:hypothetical protein
MFMYTQASFYVHDWLTLSSNTTVFFSSGISMNLYETKDRKRWEILNGSGRLNVMTWKASVIV